jgi:TolA-binding protein
MSRLRLIPVLLVAALFGASGGFSQEKKEPPKDVKESSKEKDSKEKEAVKFKGSLPSRWGQIGLSEDQKQHVYKIQGQYRDEIDKLQAKIDDLKAQQKKEMEKVLTEEQKKRLRELLLGEKDSR